MSKQTALEFLEKAATDEQLKKDLKAFHGVEGKDVVQKIVSIAGTAGFEFTAQDYAEAAAESVEEEISRKKSGELSGDDLEQVAGGVGFNDFITIDPEINFWHPNKSSAHVTVGVPGLNVQVNVGQEGVSDPVVNTPNLEDIPDVAADIGSRLL